MTALVWIFASFRQVSSYMSNVFRFDSAIEFGSVILAGGGGGLVLVMTRRQGIEGRNTVHQHRNNVQDTPTWYAQSSVNRQRPCSPTTPSRCRCA